MQNVRSSPAPKPPPIVRYTITHRTSYSYESTVTVGHYVARLAPRQLPNQECPWHEIDIRPGPAERATRVDSFGNSSHYFEIEGTHKKLIVTARSLVEIRPSPTVNASLTPAWELVRDTAQQGTWSPTVQAGEWVHASPFIPLGPDYAAYAALSFTPRRPILEAALDFNQRLFTDYKFDPSATDVTTPVAKAFKQRAGVCQDFAHVTIACLRSLGIPARYVSGYLETRPPPGQVKLVGADASHAWVSVFCGETIGWIDLDPTNNIMPSTRHITVAWGRDFSDVSPLRGVTLGAGGQTLRVAVDVMPEESE